MSQDRAPYGPPDTSEIPQVDLSSTTRECPSCHHRWHDWNDQAAAPQVDPQVDPLRALALGQLPVRGGVAAVAVQRPGADPLPEPSGEQIGPQRLDARAPRAGGPVVSSPLIDPADRAGVVADLLDPSKAPGVEGSPARAEYLNLLRRLPLLRAELRRDSARAVEDPAWAARAAPFRRRAAEEASQREGQISAAEVAAIMEDSRRAAATHREEQGQREDLAVRALVRRALERRARAPEPAICDCDLRHAAWDLAGRCQSCGRCARTDEGRARRAQLIEDRDQARACLQPGGCQRPDCRVCAEQSGHLYPAPGPLPSEAPTSGLAWASRRRRSEADEW